MRKKVGREEGERDKRGGEVEGGRKEREGEKRGGEVEGEAGAEGGVEEEGSKYERVLTSTELV